MRCNIISKLFNPALVILLKKMRQFVLSLLLVTCLNRTLKRGVGHHTKKHH